jgi:hypothetical protein
LTKIESAALFSIIETELHCQRCNDCVDLHFDHYSIAIENIVNFLLKNLANESKIKNRTIISKKNIQSESAALPVPTDCNELSKIIN